MANICERFVTVLCLIVLTAGVSSCGGGGESTSTGSKTLSWKPPSHYIDGTPLDAAAEIERYEVYINEDGRFSDPDNETASVAATDPVTKLPVTSFDLANLSPFLSQGATYYVSIRAVAMSGLKSDFSASATFSF